MFAQGARPFTDRSSLYTKLLETFDAAGLIGSAMPNQIPSPRRSCSWPSHVLYRGGRDIAARSLRDRRPSGGRLAGRELVFPVRRPGGLGHVIERGYEGYVAKDEASAYEGGPTRRWLKVKVPGWTLAEDRWRRRVAARQ